MRGASALSLCVARPLVDGWAPAAALSMCARVARCKRFFCEGRGALGSDRPEPVGWVGGTPSPLKTQNRGDVQFFIRYLTRPCRLCGPIGSRVPKKFFAPKLPYRRPARALPCRASWRLPTGDYFHADYVWCFRIDRGQRLERSERAAWSLHQSASQGRLREIPERIGTSSCSIRRLGIREHARCTREPF